MSDVRVYTVAKAAAAYSVSESTIRRAIRSTGARDDNGDFTFPPPLSAKRTGKGGYLILASELDRWVESMADA